jgi:hypothetical protein
VVKTEFCRKRLMQTESSETLIGWKSGKTTMGSNGGSAAMDSGPDPRTIPSICHLPDLSTFLLVPPLKVPKCEIFDHSDFDDFYTIKSLWGGDLWVKIKVFFLIFRGSFGAVKFLTRML